MNCDSERDSPGLQIVWHNPAPPSRSGRRPLRLALETKTIYVAGTLDSDALYELISGGNPARVEWRSAEEVCEQWG